MDYTDILKVELIPAFGCTEPISIALASAKAKEVLEENPNKIIANLSGNIIKNANSVKVPGTLGRKGINISLVAGALLGDPSKNLEVLNDIDKSKLNYCDKLIEQGIVDIKLAENKIGLYIDITMYSASNKSRVIIEGSHTNIVLIQRNEEIIYKCDDKCQKQKCQLEKFSFDSIYDFAKTCDYSDLKYILDKQISYNIKISEEGLNNKWGANIGSTILNQNSNDYFEKLAAYAAAGSDARMAGCESPVVINSGSGNQGITAAVPVIIYSRDHGFPSDSLYRALIFSNLMSLYIKQRIGKLSAYCGVVSAASSSIASIAFLENENKEIIEETLSNSLATNSGIICDGAKASCASKIASSIRNASLAYKQALSNNSFKAGDGIVKENIDDTIESVGIIASEGMKVTDQVVLNQVLKKNNKI